MHEVGRGASELNSHVELVQGKVLTFARIVRGGPGQEWEQELRRLFQLELTTAQRKRACHQTSRPDCAASQERSITSKLLLFPAAESTGSDRHLSAVLRDLGRDKAGQIFDGVCASQAIDGLPGGVDEVVRTARHAESAANA